VLRVSALAVSLGTLAVVLLVVQLARLLVGRGGARGAARLALLGVALLPAREARAQRPAADSVAILRARAEARYADGDAEGAARDYEALLARDPENSRALFRLAQLRAARPAEALSLYRRYVAAEPGDAWGHLALAEAQARAGRTGEALAAVDSAERLAPRERDVALTRARVLARAGHPAAAAAVYAARVAAAPADTDAWRALAEQRRRAGSRTGPCRRWRGRRRSPPSPRWRGGSPTGAAPTAWPSSRRPRLARLGRQHAAGRRAAVVLPARDAWRATLTAGGLRASGGATR
jgi:predicted Zn-dependent protease